MPITIKTDEQLLVPEVAAVDNDVMPHAHPPSKPVPDVPVNFLLQPEVDATVTLSAAAQHVATVRLLSEATAALGLDDASVATQKKKKHIINKLLILDVDAFRLIREKLRAKNLGTKERNAEEVERKDPKQQSVVL